jgi:hypothetical protein
VPELERAKLPHGQNVSGSNRVIFRVIIKSTAGLDSLMIESLRDPVPQRGSVLIEVKAFGTNQAENWMRNAVGTKVAAIIRVALQGAVHIGLARCVLV